MIRLLSSVRDWWRWRLRRSQLHIPGIVQFTTVGTVDAFEQGRWRIRIDDDERPVYVESDERSAAGIRMGDRVEVSPQPPFSVTTISRDKYWIVVRKLGRKDAGKE